MSDLAGRVLDERPPIIVIGMHRSGTGLVSELLQRGGVCMGTEQESNRESTLFLDLDRRVLEGLGYGWRAIDDAFPSVEELGEWFERRVTRIHELLREDLVGHHLDEGEAMDVAKGLRRWGWKDPRTSLLLPIWLRAFPDASVIHVYRDGRSVALSLMRRDAAEQGWAAGASPDGYQQRRFAADLRVWEAYEHRIRESLAGHDDTCAIRYEDLVASPESAVRALFAALGIGSDSDIDDIASGVEAGRGPSSHESAWVEGLDIASPLLHELGYLD